MYANTQNIPTTKAFQVSGLASLGLIALTIVTAVLAYLPGHPDFSIFSTYLSDIGDTPGWPQIFFNSGTLLAAPLRYLILVLLVLRLRAFARGSAAFEAGVLGVGAIATLGTVLMTAAPFSVSPGVHKTGIAFYFLGVIVLQTLIGVKELRLKELPRLLPGLSFAIVACFLIFMTFFMLSESGQVGRSAPVIWEWMCLFSSTLWLAGHTLVLGKRN
ncbi:MAG: hypothetical protein AB1894_29465 [Chloroflexota bacterium]